VKSIRIVIVDDHVMLRDGIVSILQNEPDFQVVGEAGSVAGAIATIGDVMPDLVLMDYSLPDGNGLEAIEAIHTISSEIAVVLLTMYREDELLFAAVRSGARGYLLKNISAKDMLKALRDLSQGDLAMLPAERNRIVSEFARTAPRQIDNQAKTPQLTDRELEVLRLIVRGATNRQIALELHISPNTVKNHVHNILEKLEVGSRHQAAEVAVKRRLVSAR
jgi:DNA-binding NarL/FixJ family response regulator